MVFNNTFTSKLFNMYYILWAPLTTGIHAIQFKMPKTLEKLHVLVKNFKISGIYYGNIEYYIK